MLGGGRPIGPPQGLHHRFPVLSPNDRASEAVGANRAFKTMRVLHVDVTQREQASTSRLRARRGQPRTRADRPATVDARRVGPAQRVQVPGAGSRVPPQWMRRGLHWAQTNGRLGADRSKARIFFYDPAARPPIRRASSGGRPPPPPPPGKGRYGHRRRRRVRLLDRCPDARSAVMMRRSVARRSPLPITLSTLGRVDRRRRRLLGDLVRSGDRSSNDVTEDVLRGPRRHLHGRPLAEGRCMRKAARQSRARARRASPPSALPHVDGDRAERRVPPRLTTFCCGPRRGGAGSVCVQRSAGPDASSSRSSGRRRRDRASRRGRRSRPRRRRRATASAAVGAGAGVLDYGFCRYHRGTSTLWWRPLVVYGCPDACCFGEATLRMLLAR